ncbi:hypothetical protein RU50_005513 [Salmonella enterica subsp. enterica]|nr:hypothetical protein [Salmonella enterica subsp. enterica]
MVALNSGKQTTVGSGGFFVYRQQITRRKKGSQEDPLIFFCKTSLHLWLYHHHRDTNF